MTIQRSRSTAAKHPLIAPVKAFQHSLDGAGENVLAFRMFQQLGRHHGRERERNEAGHHHGARQRHGKFHEKPPRAPRREGDGGIDGSKRHGHGDNGKAHFPRPSQGRIERLHAFFHMPVNVLQHDDGVIHHQPDGQHEGQQRQRIDREPRRIHDGKGGDAAIRGW